MHADCASYWRRRRWDAGQRAADGLAEGGESDRAREQPDRGQKALGPGHERYGVAARHDELAFAGESRIDALRLPELVDRE